MERLLRAFMIAGLFSAKIQNVSADTPTPIATLDLSGLFAPDDRVTLAFGSESQVVLGSLIGKIVAIEFHERALRPSSTSYLIFQRRGFPRGIYASRHGIVSALSRPPQFLAPDLRGSTELPIKSLVPGVPTADTVAEFQGFNSWELFQLWPRFTSIAKGNGEILSHSDDLIVSRTDREIRVQRVTGVIVGSFQVAPRSQCYEKAMLIGGDRLFLSGCKDDSIADFHGNELLKVADPRGWGFRYGVSWDGGRILFDHYTRTTTLLQRWEEYLESIISFGMAPDEQSNGESVRVIDTKTGKTCFDLDSPGHLFGVAGEYHADISPSGALAAVLNAGRLEIYGLPGVCTTAPGSVR